MTAPLLYGPDGHPLSSQPAAEAPLYEGASVGARFGDWGLSSAGPTESAFRSLGTLRKRAREMERNNPTVKGGLDSIVANMVGTDISPSFNLDNNEQRDELHHLWEDSQAEADFYGTSDFYGTIDVVCRSMERDGESLARMVDCPPEMGLLVPLQVQVLEADHLDAGYNDISPEGNEIRYGIEWRDGRRYKYWLWNDHPGESWITRDTIARQPHPVADICHIFRPLRAGQARGITSLAPILTKLYEIDLYDDAEVVRKKAAALFAGVIYSDKAVDPRKVGGEKVTGTSAVRFKAGTMPVLKPGQNISFNNTADVGNNYMDFMRVQLRQTARGWGITYEQLTGDLEGVNYTSLRAGLIEIRRLLEQKIARTLIFQYCRPYIDRWIYTAVLSGATTTITPRDYLRNRRMFHRVSWHIDGWDFTDPVKDRVAENMDIRGGIETRGQKIAKRGGNLHRVDRQNEQERQSAEKHGNAYDCYASHTNQSGTLQKIEEQVILDAAKTE